MSFCRARGMSVVCAYSTRLLSGRPDLAVADRVPVTLTSEGPQAITKPRATLTAELQEFVTGHRSLGSLTPEHRPIDSERIPPHRRLSLWG